MPELPEVETIRRGLNKILPGRLVQSVEIVGHDTFRKKSVDYARFVVGRRIKQVNRHGKGLLFEFEDGPGRLYAHLGMSGRILWTEKTSSRLPHTHLIFHLDHPDHELRYVDVRRFGWWEFFPQERTLKGIDAWNGSTEEIVKALKGQQGIIKNTLMRQDVVSGLGNIYVDEALHMAGLHPRARIKYLSSKKVVQLVDSIRTIIARSIERRGTTLRDYIGVDGDKGEFQNFLAVYGKEGKKCRCGGTIQKMVAANRGTHYCPKCQKRR